MGTYLSVPVTEKGKESGANERLNWGVVDMQGWRKSMEDAHVAQPLSFHGRKGQVFGVFDGHGGPEVARFCQLYLVSVLEQQKSENMGEALTSCFHALDRMIDGNDHRAEVVQLRLTKPAPGERKVAHNIPPPPPTQPPHAPSSPPPLAIDDEIINSSAGEGNTVEEPPHPSLTAPVSLEDDSDTKEDDDSQQPVGHNAEDQDMMDENDEEPVQQPAEDLATSTRVTAMFQRLLSMSRPTGQLTIAPDGSHAPPPPPPAPTITPSASKPSAILNGRLICNLPDHPIHAGATAIVAVLLGDQLTVANAGDSRGVLCRSGRAIPLSFDHKPQDDTELDRIRKAGGFVNQFGRVNGNLNLSRSIGDLKYKQVPGIAKADQMITAEPDIMVQTITDEDEFVILGCDGIWDCLSNEQAVDYVRQRLDDQSPTSIGAEMLSYIISDDPRMSQGIGGDNMTVMIIDLQPSNRNYTMDDDDDEEETEASTPPDSTD